MKLTGQFTRALYSDSNTVEVTFTTTSRQAVDGLKKLNGELLDLSVKRHSERRSVDANAYFWRLADELAKKLSDKGEKPVTKDEIYRNYIRDVGAFLYFPIKTREVDWFIRMWETRGDGWICQDLGESRAIPDSHTIRAYYGSSVYNKEQMSRLIDMVVADCKEQGIETRTPNEIADMLSLMEG